MKVSFSWVGVLQLALLTLLAVKVDSQITEFNCYACTTNVNDACSDEIDSQEDLPSSVTLVKCQGYCTIVRVEYTDIPGEVVSLVRDCSPEEPLVYNDIRTDKHYTKMYTSCTGEKCNFGDGKRGLTGSAGGGSGGLIGVIQVEESDSVVKTPFAAFIILATVASLVI